MASRRSLVVNGDLGSGKSTVSTLLAERLGLRRISVGDLYRELARQRGMTALQLNLHAELDDKVDSSVDQLQRDLAARDEQVIVDSRLAWHFFPNAFKVHLVTEPTVAARRVLGRPGDCVEGYASVEEARRQLAIRSDSERNRFLSRYGVDKSDLRNYDVVCDTTSATPAAVVDRILAVFGAPRPEPTLFIAPGRLVIGEGVPDDGPVRLRYAPPDFIVVTGRSRVTEDVRAGCSLVEAALAG